MSALFESGAFRKPAWHQQGVVAGDDMPKDWLGLSKLASLDWEPEELIVTPPHPIHVEEDRYKYIYRSDNKNLLSITPKTYTLFKNHMFGKVCETIVNDYDFSFEAVTSLKGGRMVTATMYMNDPWTVPGSDSETYGMLNATNTHDMTRSFQLSPGTICIVCANTAQASFAEADAHGFKITNRHTSGIEDVDAIIARARALVDYGRESIMAYRDLSLDIANGHKFSVDQFLVNWLPLPDKTVSKTVHRNIFSKRQVVKDILELGSTVGDPHNPWQIYQAAIEADQHYYKRKDAEKSALVGLNGGTVLSRKALSIAKELARV